MLVANVVIVLLVWALPSALSSGVVAAFASMLGLLGLHSLWAWLMVSPALYLLWLVSFLFFSGVSIQLIGRRFPKPRRATYPEQMRRLRGVGASLFRRTVIESLPLVSFLKAMPWGARLIIFAYSPSMKVGENVNLAPPELLVDPDLTEIGDNVVLGNGVALAAHFGKALGNGRMAYVTAPVTIGARATIGDFSLVSLGCTVGENSIIEPRSYLPPYTQVPADEVWGGRPAVFLSKLPPE